MKRRAVSAVLGAALVLTTGCGAMHMDGATSSSASQRVSHAKVPRLHHAFVVVLENHEYYPAGDPPYLASLRKAGAMATRYYGVTHPSLPNYLALLGGNTFGVQTDTFAGLLPNRTLVDQLESHGLTWKAYMEDMPTPCFPGDVAGGYVKRHNPFLYFSRIRNNPARCSRVQPFPALMEDLRHGPVPNFVWITPNLCHDAHDCDLTATDGFLRTLVPNITASLAYRDRGALFIVYDEGTSSAGCCGEAAGGRVEMLVLGPGIAPGRKIGAAASHYSLLRTVEDGFGLSHLGRAGCRCTSTLGEAWGR